MMDIGRAILILGVILLLVGGLLYLAGRANLGERLPLGRLPGDIRVEGTGFTCIFALGTSILLSILLTVILNIIIRIINR